MSVFDLAIFCIFAVSNYCRSSSASRYGSFRLQYLPILWHGCTYCCQGHTVFVDSQKVLFWPHIVFQNWESNCFISLVVKFGAVRLPTTNVSWTNVLIRCSTHVNHKLSRSTTSIMFLHPSRWNRLFCSCRASSQRQRHELLASQWNAWKAQRTLNWKESEEFAFFTRENLPRIAAIGKYSAFHLFKPTVYGMVVCELGLKITTQRSGTLQKPRNSLENSELRPFVRHPRTERIGRA